MKTLSPSIFRILGTALFLAAILASCSKDQSADRRAELLASISDDASVTVAFSPSAILKSAGLEANADGITLSKPIERLVAANSGLKKIVDFVANAKGIDYSAAVVAGGTTDGTALFALADRARFCNWAKEAGMEVTDEGDFTVCYKGPHTPAIVIDNMTAWFLGSAADAQAAAEIVKKHQAAAASNRLATWKAERLAKGDINVLVDIVAYNKEMSSAMAMLGIQGVSDIYGDNCHYSISECTFAGPTVRISGEAFDSEGNATPMFAPESITTVPSEALGVVKDDQIAIGGTLPDAWKSLMLNILMARSGLDSDQAAIVKQTVDAFKSLVIGLSTREGMSITSASPSDVTANVFINYDKAQATKAVEMMMPFARDLGIASQLSEVWKALSGESTYTITPEATLPDFKLYLSGRDALAIVSTDPAMSEAKLPADPKLAGLIGYVNIDLKKSHPALSLSGCPFGIEARFTTTNEKSEGYLTLTDTDRPLLESLITFISRFL